MPDTTSISEFRLRKALSADIPQLQELIEASVRGLQTGFYTPEQIDGALQSVYGVDSQLIADGTYFCVDWAPPAPIPATVSPHSPALVACGGWSRRKTLYGGDQFSGREDSLLDPRTHAAKIRAFFVHPAWARRGIGTLILHACEQAALAAGFTRIEMGATLSGVDFYRAHGYEPAERQEVPLGPAKTLPILRMTKHFAR